MRGDPVRHCNRVRPDLEQGLGDGGPRTAQDKATGQEVELPELGSFLGK